jgi:hypothetical protein
MIFEQVCLLDDRIRDFLIKISSFLIRPTNIYDNLHPKSQCTATKNVATLIYIIRTFFELTIKLSYKVIVAYPRHLRTRGPLLGLNFNTQAPQYIIFPTTLLAKSGERLFGFMQLQSPATTPQPPLLANAKYTFVYTVCRSSLELRMNKSVAQIASTALVQNIVQKYVPTLPYTQSLTMTAEIKNATSAVFAQYDAHPHKIAYATLNNKQTFVCTPFMHKDSHMMFALYANKSGTYVLHDVLPVSSRLLGNIYCMSNVDYSSYNPIDSAAFFGPPTPQKIVLTVKCDDKKWLAENVNINRRCAIVRNEFSKYGLVEHVVATAAATAEFEVEFAIFVHAKNLWPNLSSTHMCITSSEHIVKFSYTVNLRKSAMSTYTQKYAEKQLHAMLTADIAYILEHCTDYGDVFGKYIAHYRHAIPELVRTKGLYGALQTLYQIDSGVSRKSRITLINFAQSVREIGSFRMMDTMCNTVDLRTSLATAETTNLELVPSHEPRWGHENQIVNTFARKFYEVFPDQRPINLEAFPVHTSVWTLPILVKWPL